MRNLLIVSNISPKKYGPKLFHYTKIKRLKLLFSKRNATAFCTITREKKNYLVNSQLEIKVQDYTMNPPDWTTTSIRNNILLKIDEDTGGGGVRPDRFFYKH